MTIVNFLTKLVGEVIEQNKGVQFETPLFGWDSNSAKAIFALDHNPDYYFEDDEDMISKISSSLASKTDLYLSTIRYSKNGFGFGNDIFCHVKRMVGTTEDFEVLCNQNRHFIIHPQEGDKGWWATWFCPVELIDDKTKDIVKSAILEALKDEMTDVCRQRYWQEERAKAERAKAAALAALGIASYEKIIHDERSSYGGHKKYTYIFPTPVTRETFVEFLKLNHLVVEAKECNLPICHEDVHYSSLDGLRWSYEWSGEWTD